MRDDLHAAIEPLLIDYAAGTLNLADRSRVEAHLADCDECRLVLDEWQQIATAARDSAFSRRALPPLDWHRIKGEEPMTPIPMIRPAAPVRATSRRLPLTLVAVIALTAFLSAQLLRSPQNEQPSVAVLQAATATPTPTFTSTPAFTPSATPQLVQTMPFTILSTLGPDSVVMAVNIPELPEGYWPYVVAKQAIEGGAPIQPDDFELHLVEIVTTPRANFTKDVIIRPVHSLAMFCGPMNLEVIAAGAGRPPSNQAGCSLEPGSNLFLHYDGSAAQRTATPTPTPTFTSTSTVSPFAQQSTAIPQLLPSATPSATSTVQRQFPPTYTPRPNLYIVNGFNLAAIPPDVSPVIVAANQIENGAVIKPHDLSIYLIDKDLLPEGSQFNPDEIVYKIARFNISCGQILTLDYGVRNARDVPDGQPTTSGVSCYNVERTYRPGAGGVARDYDGRLYSNPVGYSANVLLFASDLKAGSILTEADIALAPDYPIELVPQSALTDPEAIVGQPLIVPVIAGQIISPNKFITETAASESIQLIDVNVRTEDIELPDDAQFGGVFDIYTDLPDSQGTNGTSEPAVAIFGVVLKNQFSNFVVLTIRLEDESMLQALIEQSMPIRLVPSE